MRTAITGAAAPLLAVLIVAGAPAPVVGRGPADPRPAALVVSEVLGGEVTPTPAGALRTTSIEAGSLLRGRASGAAISVPTGTQMLGVRWVGDGHLDLRARIAGRWSDWLHLGDGAESGGRRTGGPVWLGEAGADRVELRADDGPAGDIGLEAMRFTPSSGRRALVVDRSATPAGGPSIHTRASWAPSGWASHIKGCGSAPSTSEALRFSVIHHTVSASTYSEAAVPGILAAIQRFHVGTNGWCDIAYNLLVDRFGRVWEGRSGGIEAPILGGHTKGFNTDSVGVALIGDHSSTGPSSAAWTALRDTVAWKLGAHGVDPTAAVTVVSRGSTRFPAGRRVTLPTIQGHVDSAHTSCPGEALRAQLGRLRTEVAARIAEVTDARLWAPARSGPAFFGRLATAATGRPAANGGPGRHTILVTRRGASRDELAATLVLSPATDQRIGAVERLYRAAFARNAETAGLRHWVGRRTAGESISTLARQFSGSTEFTERYRGLDDTAFTHAIYRNVLGRPGEPTGVAYWVRRLGEGLTRHQMLASVSESGENRATTAIDSTITVAGFVLLDRAMSASERARWRTALRGGSDGGALVAALLRSSELAI